MDHCPGDGKKSEPGACGCGKSELACRENQDAGAASDAGFDPWQSQGTDLDLARARGLIVNRVADFTLTQQADDRLLMAYGHLSESEILTGVERLRAALR